MTDNAAKISKLRATNTASAHDGVECKLDGKWVHSIKAHLQTDHPTMTLDGYMEQFPGEPIESEYLIGLRSRSGSKPASPETTSASTVVAFTGGPSAGFAKEPMHKVFGMRASKKTENAKGQQIQVTVLTAWSEEQQDYIGDTDPNHVWDAELLRTINMGVELNIPTLLWGFHGTGKSSNFEQYAANTKRPYIRVQHTVSTEEAHILGQYVVKSRDGERVMEFEPGPLAYAMRHGLIYLADEYDFALPSVTSVYQPVLEGKALIIKEAPPEWRIVRPHPNFRFWATGNTNGSGDETGLYQGTQIMNAANYSRFGITEQVSYMDADTEKTVVQKQAGVHPEDAAKIVMFAGNVRQAYAKGELSVTVSPRELINAGRIGVATGLDWRNGLRKAYINRLPSTDRKAVDDFAQRVFGDTTPGATTTTARAAASVASSSPWS